MCLIFSLVAKPSKSRNSFGSAYRKQRADGTKYPNWFVRYVEAGRRVERGGFATKDAALTFLAARRVDRSEARAVGIPELRRVLVEDLFVEFTAWATVNRRESTVKSQTCLLRKFVAFLGRREAISVQAEDVMQWIAAMRRDRSWSPVTQHAALTAVAALFRYAVEHRVVRASPTQGVRRRLPRADVNEPPFIPSDELRRIYRAMPPTIRTCVILMGEAGLRRNEAVELLWSEVSHDFARVTIRAERSKSHRARTVPLTAEAAAALRARRTAIPLTDARVFPDVSPHSINHDFRKAADRIGRHDVSPHVLRHAFASGLVRAGVDLATVQKLMGHRSIVMTMRYACHAPGDAADLAIRALEKSRSLPYRDVGSEPR